MKKIIKYSNFLIAAPFIIYLYNLIACPFNLIIPINVISILMVGFLGIPGLITLLMLLICI